MGMEYLTRRFAFSRRSSNAVCQQQQHWERLCGHHIVAGPRIECTHLMIRLLSGPCVSRRTPQREEPDKYTSLDAIPRRLAEAQDPRMGSPWMIFPETHRAGSAPKLSEFRLTPEGSERHSLRRRHLLHRPTRPEQRTCCRPQTTTMRRTTQLRASLTLLLQPHIPPDTTRTGPLSCCMDR
jgi:hypothetical protein